ncbi:MAG: isoprenylcysteine carboxylmethyltransferase family protein [Flavobacteriales bacterium]|jgi:protein-S-isoprenylcysteine O-methyltransferase Ste14|nr:isoprenylcysteine carboxylmethyltransferase family protein [Flavobacteriales bacterium]
MYLFIFLIIYFFLVFFLRSYLLWRKTKINPFTFSKGDDAHGYNGKIFSFISVIEIVVVAIYAFNNSWMNILLPFWYLEYEILVIIGWVLLFISLIVVSIAQTQMANSWRIGIDEKNKTELVTKGFFSMSRNPIFLGIMIANIGLFLVLPNAFTLLIISLSTVSINTQIRLEEAFLEMEHGKEYSNYKQKVRRWI